MFSNERTKNEQRSMLLLPRPTNHIYVYKMYKFLIYTVYCRGMSNFKPNAHILNWWSWIEWVCELMSEWKNGIKWSTISHLFSLLGPHSSSTTTTAWLTGMPNGYGYGWWWWWKEIEMLPVLIFFSALLLIFQQNIKILF